MKRILVLHTGGTIAMEENEQGHVVPQLENPLDRVSFNDFLKTGIELQVEDIFNLPSPHITLEHMLLIKNRIQRAAKEGFIAVVLTHGTDTLEETAYFLELTIGDVLPIIVTGAMRSSNELGSDGLYNYQSALRVAAAAENDGKGVLVVMNDEIHMASHVTKTHTTNVATFRTPTFGPIGILTKEQVLFYQQPLKIEHQDVTTMKGLVPIVKAYAGMDASFLELLNDFSVDGLVIEALGAGNLPPQTLPALEKLLSRKIPIILVSRCFNGVAEAVYGYRGGGQDLKEKGVIFAGSLNSQKARLKLLVALNSHLTAAAFEQFIKDARD